ncbi:MtrAB system histidine kinase MtrB [uncultured Tessaracoccus sp.]|uniref:MtrAB system histidine kinase MtrB n=1 Tax=uncultured Tessaracoccus sp. TaxID=905023 RepID=UPI0025E935A2|nr:MtrAB system histidine kinase MtrB [uncultured Tessaracoccus sp.]
MPAKPDGRPRRWLRWWSSLPLRVLVTTALSTIVLLGLAGTILVHMAADGITDAKRQAVINEASGVRAFMQQQLRAPDARGAALSESLNRLAESVNTQTTQYQMVIRAPTSTLVSGGLEASSVPAELVRRVANDDGLHITPTSVVWADDRASEPGFAVGTTLVAAGGERVPVFYVFPMTSEVQVLQWIRYAVVVTFGLLLAALTVIVTLITWQVVRPVRRASHTALGLASGRLDERMEVRGTDEFASLARSMNQMAEQLQARIRELERLSAVQRRFVSDVSHELRTPLTTIRMASDLLYEQRGDSDAASARTVELMATEIERFDALLADLLEISRFDAGAAVLALDDHDLATIVADELDGHRSLAEREGIELRLHVRSEDTRARLDARRVRRILRNLLGNAIDHGRGRPVDVTVAGDERTVAVAVRDHGVGFEPDQSSRVFDRFWRADPSRTRVVGGTGLGLSIALEDAKLHHGWLTAWGRPGEGAQFRLTLPRDAEGRVLLSPLPVMPEDLEGSQP